MIVSVASGKGGTEKTSVAVNMALSIQNVQLLDCDVEEPNAYLFLNPKTNQTRPVTVSVPLVDEKLTRAGILHYSICSWTRIACKARRCMLSVLYLLGVLKGV